MSYIKDNLNTGEKINYFEKPSIKPVIVVFFMFFPAIFFISLVLDWIPIIFPIIFTVIFLLGTLTTIYVTEYAITNKRVITKRGLIVRIVEEMNLGSIEGVNFGQGIFGRIFNYGSIIISGRGTSNVHFKDIDNPVEIRKKIKHKS